MITELTNSARPLNREDIRPMITAMIYGEKAVTDFEGGALLFEADNIYLLFGADSLYIRTINRKYLLTLQYENILRIAVESDECGVIYLSISMQDGLRVILDESAVSFTAEAKRQVLEEQGGNR